MKRMHYGVTQFKGQFSPRRKWTTLCKSTADITKGTQDASKVTCHVCLRKLGHIKEG